MVVRTVRYERPGVYNRRSRARTVRVDFKYARPRIGNNRFMTAYWKTLSHNGVHFPPLYEPAGLAVRVKGKRVELLPLAEEMAYVFAKKKDTPYVQDTVFTSNFTNDFEKELPAWCKGAKFGDIDFS